MSGLSPKEKRDGLIAFLALIAMIVWATVGPRLLGVDTVLGSLAVALLGVMVGLVGYSLATGAHKK
jgi:hypothetical protein